MGANSDAGAANAASRRSPGMVRPPEMLVQGYLDHKKHPLPVGAATRGASSQCVVLFYIRILGFGAGHAWCVLPFPTLLPVVWYHT